MGAHNREGEVILNRDIWVNPVDLYAATKHLRLKDIDDNEPFTLEGVTVETGKQAKKYIKEARKFVRWSHRLDAYKHKQERIKYIRYLFICNPFVTFIRDFFDKAYGALIFNPIRNSYYRSRRAIKQLLFILILIILTLLLSYGLQHAYD